MIGRSVGKYRILDRLGRGGMGTVYRAIDDTLEREVAIKVLNADVTEPETLKRFRAEAITLAKLHHPSIATLYELREEDGVPDEYLEASFRTMPEDQRAGFEEQVRALYDSMVRIVITPAWVRLNDFQRTAPRAVERLVRARQG